jgi:hypothetical protein
MAVIDHGKVVGHGLGGGCGTFQRSECWLVLASAAEVFDGGHRFRWVAFHGAAEVLVGLSASRLDCSTESIGSFIMALPPFSFLDTYRPTPFAIAMFPIVSPLLEIGSPEPLPVFGSVRPISYGLVEGRSDQVRERGSYIVNGWAGGWRVLDELFEVLAKRARRGEKGLAVQVDKSWLSETRQVP